MSWTQVNAGSSQSGIPVLSDWSQDRFSYWKVEVQMPRAAAFICQDISQKYRPLTFAPIETTRSQPE